MVVSSCLGAQEGQQIFVELVLAGEGQAMVGARIDLQGCVLDKLCGLQFRDSNWHNLIVIPVDDQRWNVKLACSG